MRRLRQIFALAILTMPPSGAGAFAGYDACVAQIPDAPERTAELAEKWARLDGGWPAQHCRALALIAMGAQRTGAAELTSIAFEATELPRQSRSELFVHAGEIFVELDLMGEARQSLDRALNLAEDPRDALRLSAMINEASGRPQAAINDLDRAIELGPPTSGLLVARSAVRHRAGDLVGARGDASWALELAPNDPDAWFQHGQVEALLGNTDGARDAWLKTIELARGQPLARAAQTSLQRLEAGL
ncbi:MAG: hypothetical protein AAF501_12590 [Pseudomonadota bacterium]